jgi:hypothetical protein
MKSVTSLNGIAAADGLMAIGCAHVAALGQFGGSHPDADRKRARHSGFKSVRT